MDPAPRPPYEIQGSRPAIIAAGSLAVAADLATTLFDRLPVDLHYAARGLGAAAILVIMLLTRAAPRSDYGLNLRDAGSDFRWILKLSSIVFGIFIALLGASLLLIRWGAIEFDPTRYRDFRSSSEVPYFLLRAVVVAPVVEELIYRGLAVPALAAAFGNRAAVVLSGPLFYALHMAYGWPWLALHYFAAGWILAFAFVRRGRLWVPILLHALGNIMMALDDLIWVYLPGLGHGLIGR